MPTFTVHAPPSRNGSAADPQRFVFVRDGFHFWAFLLAPLWLLVKQLWLVFAGYVVLIGAIEAAYYFLKLPQSSQIVIDFLINVLIGLEASTLQRWTYSRNKWATLGIVTGDDQEEAERRFFVQWAERPSDTKAAASPSSAASSPAPVSPAPRASDGEIIGLFPQPGGRP
jgi:hypothetical protein